MSKRLCSEMVTGFDWRFLQDMDYKFRRLNSWRGTVDADYDVNNGARAAQPAHDEHAQADVDEELPAGDQQHVEHMEVENMEIEDDP